MFRAHGAGLAGTLALAWLVALPPALRAEPSLCWAPAELAGAPREKASIRNAAEAFVPPPRELLVPFGPVERGAIRRVTLPPGDKRIALTFDLCEQPNEISGYDGDVVAALREAHAKATFFAGGKWMLTHPERAQQLIADPLFEIGSHGFSHRNQRLIGSVDQEREISWAQAAYERQAGHLAGRSCLARDGQFFRLTAGNARMQLFRFPFGACNASALDAAARLGVRPIQWDVSSGDFTKGMTPEALAAGVVRSVRPGSIVLMHANGRGWSTGAALRIIIPALRKKGFELATVGELLAAGTWRAEDTCYDKKPGDTERHDALGRLLEASYRRFNASFGATGSLPPPAALAIALPAAKPRPRLSIAPKSLAAAWPAPVVRRAVPVKRLAARTAIPAIRPLGFSAPLAKGAAHKARPFQGGATPPAATIRRAGPAAPPPVMRVKAKSTARR